MLDFGKMKTRLWAEKIRIEVRYLRNQGTRIGRAWSFFVNGQTTHNPSHSFRTGRLRAKNVMQVIGFLTVRGKSPCV
jgi:hypothetical protein